MGVSGWLGFVVFQFLGLITTFVGQSDVWITHSGHIDFQSDASLELIKAHTEKLQGVLQPIDKKFAFTVDIISFKGFNSDFQREHFMENYLEEKKFPKAQFRGKIIEDIPWDTPGTYSVRAKGNLEIHGVVKERIIRGSITIGKDKLHLSTQFTVPLADHGIGIPKVVKQKIAEQIEVNVEMDFEPST